jgi:hypothetical protein
VNAADAREAEAIEMGELDQSWTIWVPNLMDDDALVSMISNLISELIEECVTNSSGSIYSSMVERTKLQPKGSCSIRLDKCLQYLGRKTADGGIPSLKRTIYMNLNAITCVYNSILF